MKYSIITINYNNRDGLERTIQSVINQTCQDFEYIIIDGGSTDGSVDVIKKYADRIDYWVSEPDKGIYNAMNKGILQAHGEYLNFMNSGDCFYDEKVLYNVIPYLTHDIIHGKMYNEKYKTYAFHYDSFNPTFLFFYESSLNHQSCFIHSSLFVDSLYDENYKIVSDWKFYTEKIIFDNCTIINIPLVVSSFQGGGITECNADLNKFERQQVLKQMFPLKILADYEKFKDKESPVLYLIPKFNHTYRLEKLISWMINVILKLYKFVK